MKKMTFAIAMILGLCGLSIGAQAKDKTDSTKVYSCEPDETLTGWSGYGDAPNTDLVLSVYDWSGKLIFDKPIIHGTTEVECIEQMTQLNEEEG